MDPAVVGVRGTQASTFNAGVQHVRSGPQGGGGRDALEGGEPAPPPPGHPATVPLTASARLNGICNRH